MKNKADNAAREKQNATTAREKLYAKAAREKKRVKTKRDNAVHEKQSGQRSS